MNEELEMNNELYHYGVKGMKWGVRHDPERQGIRDAKKNYKKANRQYGKDYDRAYNYSARHPISQHIKKSPTYEESNKRWEKAYDSAVASNKAKANLKAEKKKYKENKAARNIKRMDEKITERAEEEIRNGVVPYKARRKEFHEKKRLYDKNGINPNFQKQYTVTYSYNTGKQFYQQHAVEYKGCLVKDLGGTIKNNGKTIDFDDGELVAYEVLNNHGSVALDEFYGRKR